MGLKFKSLYSCLQLMINVKKKKYCVISIKHFYYNNISFQNALLHVLSDIFISLYLIKNVIKINHSILYDI